MECVRDEYGAIELKKISYDIISEQEMDHFIIKYKGQIYYLKYLKNTHCDDLYNGLIAYELSKDYNIDVVYTDIFMYDNFYGILSKGIENEYDTYLPINKYIEINNNNLEDIWNSLNNIFNDKRQVAKLMCEIVNMFIFDVLLGNIDRHIDNYGFILKNNWYSLAPLFDNEKILSNDSINECFYSIGVDSMDYNNYDINILHKFLVYSDKMYLDMIKSKLWIIEQQNILKALNRIEERIGCSIQINIKESILKRFEINYDTINRVIKKYESGDKKYAYTI